MNKWPSISPTGYHTIYFVYCRHSTDLLYIGVTGYRLKKRFNSNKWFRPKDMWYEPVMVFSGREEAEDWEEYLICYFNPPKNKYLAAKGKGQKQDIEWVQRRANAVRGTKASEERKRKIGEANGHKVRCVETGDEFYSLSEAARWCGGSDSKISLVVRGKRKSHKGYKWELIK